MPHQQVRLNVLQTHLRSRWDNSSYWSAAEEIAVLNEALRMWNILTGMWKDRVTLPTVADQVYYSVPSPLTHAVKMTWNEYTLSPASLHEMDMGHPGWEGQTTASGGNVPTKPAKWIRVGLTTFALWPADAADDNSLVVDGTLATPVMDDVNDYIDIGQEELGAIMDYALHIAAFKGDKTRWATTMNSYAKFLEAAGKKNTRLKHSALYKRYMHADMQRDEVPLVK